jgi:hypothetical protein
MRKRGVDATSPKIGDQRTPELLFARTLHLRRDFKKMKFNVSAHFFHCSRT